MTEPSSADGPLPHDPYAVWRQRNYLLYAAGWFLMVCGKQVETVAVLWVMHQATKDALDLGLVGLVQALPVMLLALPAGQWADRFDRRRMLLVTLTVGVAGTMGLWAVVSLGAAARWMYPCLLAASIGRAVGGPARTALLPQLVAPELFSTAVAWNASIFQIGTMIGPAIGGLLTAVNPSAAFLVSAASQTAMWIMVAMIRGHRPSGAAYQAVGWRGLLKGLEFVWRTRLILAAMTLDMFAVLLGGATYLLPIFADDILGVGATGQGFLRSAEALGALIMATYLAHRPPLRRAGRALLWAVAGFGLATIVLGLSRWFWLSLLAMAAIGALDNISVVVRHTLVQMLTPDAMRGRVSAINGVFITASNDLGGLESGLTTRLFGDLARMAGWADSDRSARIWGATASVVLGGLGTLLVVLTANALWPQLRRIGSLASLRPLPLNGQPTCLPVPQPDPPRTTPPEATSSFTESPRN